MPDVTPKETPVTEDELLVLKIVTTAGFARQRKPSSHAERAMRELVGAGLLRTVPGGYSPTDAGRTVVEVNGGW